MTQIKNAVLRRKQVEMVTGLPRATLYGKIRAGKFPRPVPLGARAVGWRAADVELWLSNPTGWTAEAQKNA